MYKLLIVDDNYYDRMGILELDEWKSLNFGEIYLAEDGEDGLAKALETEPLLVITDVSMPGMDGVAMAREILKKLPNTKFIFISCFEDSEYIRDAISVNAFAYILKPIKIQELMEAVKKILKINEIEQNQVTVIKNLTSMLEDQMPLLQERTLRDLVYGEIPDEKHLETVEMSVQGLCSFSLLRLDFVSGTTEEYEHVNNYLAINKINRLFCEITEQRIYSYMIDNKYIAVLSYHDDNEDGFQVLEDTIEFYEHIKGRIINEFGVNVHICIGGVTKNLSDINILYTKARRMLELNPCQTSNIIVVSDDGENKDMFLDYDLRSMKEELTGALTQKNRHGCSKIVNKYFENADLTDKRIVKEFTLSVICTLQLILYEMNMSLAEIFGGEYLIWEKLSRFDTIVDIKRWIYNILQGIIEHIEKKDREPNAKLANELKSIIKQKYLELHTVSQVAEQAFVSTVHANNVFKKVYGCTMFDYLTKIKLEKAKELLKKTDMKVYEIADHIGYKSKTYFTSLFKDYTGMTPKEYRMLKD